MKVLLLLIFVSSLYYVHSLKCICNTNDAGCKVGICEGNFCFKRETQAEGKTTVSKGCDTAGVNTCTGVSVLGYGAGACQCDTGDFCNSSPISKPLTMLAIGSAFVLSIFYKYL